MGTNTRDRGIAYTVEMHRMRPANSESGDGKLDGRVPRKTVYAARRKEISCVLSTAQNLKEDRDIGVDEGGAVDGEAAGRLWECQNNNRSA